MRTPCHLDAPSGKGEKGFLNSFLGLIEDQSVRHGTVPKDELVEVKSTRDTIGCARQIDAI